MICSSRFKLFFRNSSGLKGFTLIELLVVVLIIGILAAIALPQYHKVVARSKAAKALPLLNSLFNSSKSYYLSSGKYPLALSKVNIGLNFTSATKPKTSFFSQTVAGTDAIRRFKDFEIFISGNGVDYIENSAVFITGKYVGSEFTFFHYINPKKWPGLKADTLYCVEFQSPKFKEAPGSFCEEVMGYTYLGLFSWGSGWNLRFYQ